ncbi:S8 family serine peptidase [Maricaulis sp.]|uniref:S8 family serine peptidase n=1 Tax=Maricaulis sp. TaxID=1486257 RepID=UPI002633B390|nr:S8 family serine peptidase [Maricaulis sp.]
MQIPSTRPALSRLRKTLLVGAAVMLTSLAPAATLAASQDTRPQIQREADIPRSEYRLPDVPSVLILETPEALAPLREALDADVSAILDGCEISDIATRRTLLRHRLRIALSGGDWERALATIEDLRALEDSAAEKAAVSYQEAAFARAAIETGTGDAGDPRFQAAYRRTLTQQLAVMDVSVSGAALRGAKNSAEIVTPALLRGGLEGALDPNAQAQGLVVGRGMISVLLANRQLVEFLPLNPITADVIGARLAEEQPETVDLWSQRLVDLSDAGELTPVTVGIWDSGTDVSLFGDRVWVNPRESLNGRDDDGNGFVDDVNGIGFAPGWTPSTGVLRPVPQEDVDVLDQALLLVKGARDMHLGLDSEEAALFRRTMASLEADEYQGFQLRLQRMGLYIHGTATADIAQRGNPAVRLLPVRFDQAVGTVPAPFDEASAEQFTDYVRASVDYLDDAGARVVNMSWRITTPQIEASLASVEPDADRRRERAVAIFDTMNNALRDAFAAKPHMLFVAGAGNENEDVEFVRSMPAGINLPNLLTVGAVDQALRDTHFTSYGASIDVYANGQNIPSRVPGGLTVSLSGTSMSAPQVTNLAAMIWALQPELSVAEVREMILANATAEGDQPLPVISHAATLAGMID